MHSCMHIVAAVAIAVAVDVVVIVVVVVLSGDRYQQCGYVFWLCRDCFARSSSLC